MSTCRNWTIRIFKEDFRTKAKEVLVGSYDYTDKDEPWMREEIRDLRSRTYQQGKYRIELHETWVERVNRMSGEKFWERFDTPYHCSPSSETYWSQ